MHHNAVLPRIRSDPLHFIVRETEEEAWAAADKLISRVTEEQIEKAQARFLKEMDSVGQRRMSELHGGRRDRLVVAPNLWAGVGLVRGGAGTALVGTPAQVAGHAGSRTAPFLAEAMAEG